MSSATSVNALFKAMATKHAIGSVEAIQVQDQLARTMFGVPLKALSPMQRQAVEMSAMTVINSGGSNMLGIADGGAVYADIYKGLISSATGLSTDAGMSFGHSPQMMSAASSVMQNMNQTIYGKGFFGVGTGGNMKIMGGVMRQYLQQNGLGEGSTRTLSRKGKSFGSFVQSVGTDSGLTETEKQAIVGQELSGAVFDAYKKRIESLSEKEAKELGIEDLVNRSYDSMSEVNKRRVERAIAKQAKKDKEKGDYKKRVQAVKDEKLKEYEAELDSQNLSADEKERELALFRRSMNKAELGDLDNAANVAAASRASKGENEYTALTKAAAQEQKKALRRAASLTKEMSEVFGTEDADQLLNIAKQFGSKTLTAEKDVQNMKRIMDIARTRAAATGRTLTDVMGEMQGIAAVGAQAVGSHGVTAAYLENATRQMQASQASRNAGMDRRTDTEVTAEITEHEQNFQRNAIQGLYALAMLGEDSKEYQEWSKIFEGPLTPAKLEQLRLFGIAYNNANEWNTAPKKMQEVALNSKLASKARKAYWQGILGDHSSGHVTEMVEWFLQDETTPAYKAVMGTFGNRWNASRSMQAVLLAYGGQQKELEDDFKTISRLSILDGRPAWIADKIEQLKQNGASQEDIDQAEAAWNVLSMIANAGDKGKRIMRQMHNMQNAEIMRNTVGSIENVKAEARHLQSLRSESMKRSKEAAGSEGAIVGGLNYNDASDEAKISSLVFEADRSIARTGGVDLIGNKDGALHVDNINNLKYDELKPGAQNDITRFIAENAVAFKTDKNGMVDMEYAKSIALQIDQNKDASEAGRRKYNSLRSALGLEQGASITDALDNISQAELTRTIYEAENSGTAGVMHGKGGLVVGGTGEEMEKAAEGVKLQNALKIVGHMGFFTKTQGYGTGIQNISEIGKAVVEGTVTESQLDTARAIVDSGQAGSGVQSIMATFEAAGVKNVGKRTEGNWDHFTNPLVSHLNNVERLQGTVFKKDFTFVTDKNGIPHDINSAKDLIGFMAETAKDDLNLQQTLQKNAEEGDKLASSALIQKGLNVFKPYTAHGTSGSEEAEGRKYVIRKVAEEMAGSKEEGERRSKQMAADFERIDELQSKLNSGTLSDEEHQNAVAELEAIDVKHARWLGGGGRDAAFNKHHNIKEDSRFMSFVHKYANEWNVKQEEKAVEDGKKKEDAVGKIVVDNMVGELYAAQGTSEELKAIREQLEVEKQNKTMFDKWNEQLTECKGGVVNQKSLTIRQSVSILAACCRWVNDQWQIYTEVM